MTESELPAAPAGLGAGGRSLWRSIAQGVVDAGFQLDEIEACWLRTACEIEDRSRTLEAAMAGQDLHVRGSHGQPVLAPEWAEWRQQRQLQTQVLARVKRAVDEALRAADRGGLAVARAGPNQHRGAALARWRKDSA